MKARLAILLVACMTAGMALAAKSAAGQVEIADRIERLVKFMLPQDKLNEAAGFFGPVTKRYLPDVQAFQADYQAADDKRAVIVKYLPKLEAALAEAKKMRVPPRFELEKAGYIRTAEVFLKLLKLALGT